MDIYEFGLGEYFTQGLPECNLGNYNQNIPSLHDVIITNHNIIDMENYNHNSYTIYNNIVQNQMANLTAEQKNNLDMYQKSISKMDKNQELFNMTLDKRSNEFHNISQYFIQDSPMLQAEYNRLSALGYGPAIGNTSYYQQGGQQQAGYDYKYQSYMANSNFRNGQVPTQYRPISPYLSYGNGYGYNGYYYGESYEDRMIRENGMEMLKLMGSVLNQGNNNSQGYQKSEYELKLEAMEREHQLKLFKYGTINDQDIRVLELGYGITEDKLNTEEHRQALMDIEIQNMLFMDDYINGVIYERAVPNMYNQINYNLYNFYASRPVINTIEDFNNMLRYNAFIDDCQREMKARRDAYLEQFKSFEKSDAYKMMHQVGRPDQIVNGYGYKGNENLAKYLHERKAEGFNNLSDNPISNMTVDQQGNLSVTMNPNYAEILKMRQYRAKQAYEAGKNYHQ